jgi:osmotically inducible protein OsmC
MPVRTANAVWEGTLHEGEGRLTVGSGAFDEKYTWSSRFESDPATNPEELLGAAHAGCFTMALSAALERAGHPVKSVRTRAQVHLTKGESGFGISKIELITEGDVPGIDEATFVSHAQTAKENCIVSRALKAVEMTVQASLVG